MSRNKVVKIKRGNSYKRTKNNNVILIKLVDPIIQSLLIVSFFYFLGAEVSFTTGKVLLLLVALQLVSVVLNFFMKETKLLKVERTVYTVLIILFLAFYLYYSGHVREQYVSINDVDPANIPLHHSILMMVAMPLCLWYNVICYREMKGLFRMLS